MTENRIFSDFSKWVIVSQLSKLTKQVGFSVFFQNGSDFQSTFKMGRTFSQFSKRVRFSVIFETGFDFQSFFNPGPIISLFQTRLDFQSFLKTGLTFKTCSRVLFCFFQKWGKTFSRLKSTQNSEF